MPLNRLWNAATKLHVSAASADAGWRLALGFCDDAVELAQESPLDGLGAALPPRYAADVRPVNIQLARDSAIQPAQRLHVVVND